MSSAEDMVWEVLEGRDVSEVVTEGLSHQLAAIGHYSGALAWPVGAGINAAITTISGGLIPASAVPIANPGNIPLFIRGMRRKKRLSQLPPSGPGFITRKVKPAVKSVVKAAPLGDKALSAYRSLKKSRPAAALGTLKDYLATTSPGRLAGKASEVIALGSGLPTDAEMSSAARQGMKELRNIGELSPVLRWAKKVPQIFRRPGTDSPGPVVKQPRKRKTKLSSKDLEKVKKNLGMSYR